MIAKLLMAALSAASPSNIPQLPASLVRAVAGYDAAQVAGDRSALKQYLAADYLLVNGAAETETKAELISDFTDPKFKLNPYRVENPIVRYWPRGAVLAGDVSLSGMSDGRAFAAHTHFVDVWRLRAGRWEVVYTQVTRFPPAAR
jgi:hypothetical protein